MNSTTNPRFEEEHICLHVLIENSVLDFQMFHVSPLRISSSWPPLLPAFQTSQISGRPTVHRHGHPVEHRERRHHYLKCSATSDGKWWCDLSQRFPAKKKTNMELENHLPLERENHLQSNSFLGGFKILAFGSVVSRWRPGFPLPNATLVFITYN